MRGWALAALLMMGGVGIGLGARLAWQPPTPAMQVKKPAPSNRIVYPADRLPVLTLPDGRKEIVRSLLNVDRPLHYGDYRWDDAGVPAGPTWVRIDLGKQTLSLFRAGHEIGSAVILYGTDGKPTPHGVFPILEKNREHQSSLYDAEMPFMLRLTGDGVAIHASNVKYGRATHGCVGIPPDFARLLFDQVKRRDPVAIIA